MLGNDSLSRFFLGLLCGGLFTQTGYAGTGPEYLSEEEDSSPLSVGFTRLKLPFVEDRESSLHLRSYYLNRNRDQYLDQEDWAVGGWRLAKA